MKKTIVAVMILAMSLMSSCGGGIINGLPDDFPRLPDPSKSIGLENFKSCDDMDAYLKDAMVMNMDTALNNTLENACKYTPDYYNDGGGAVMPASETGGSSFTDTNVQEEGVDEGDIIKTDGEYAYILSGEKFRIVRVWPVESFESMNELTIEGTPDSLYLFGYKVAVISTLNSRTKVTIISVRDSENAKVLRESYYKGYVVSSRRIEDKVYLVTNAWLSIPSIETSVDYDLLPDCNNEGTPKGAPSKKMIDAIKAKRAAGLATIENWHLNEVMSQTHKLEGVKTENVLSCSDIKKHGWSHGAELTGLVTINMRNHNEKDSSSYVLGGSNTVYASTKSIFLASYEYANKETVIHRFEIEDGNKAPQYFGSGKIQGALLNQFSMSEYDGYLRVATSVDNSHEMVVLDIQNANLPMVGKVDGIGKNEALYSVRFIGDRGYAVTFKKIDPLFVIDLSDPENPRVAGELKVPGFSTYLHPLDENHIIGLGKDGDDMGSFAWFQGVKLSIFDVSDSENPIEDFSHVIGSRGTMSPALYDHHAFTFDRSQNMLALPLTLCTGTSGGSQLGTFEYSGVQVLTLDPENGVDLVSEIKGDQVSDYDSCNGWQYSGDTLRTVIMNDSGSTFVLVLATDGLTINSIEGENLGEVSWETPKESGWCGTTW